MGFILLGIHILLCAVIGYCLLTKKIKVRTPIYASVVCIPIVGVLLLLVDLWADKKRKHGIHEIGMEKLKLTDTKYRTIQVEQNDNTEIVVPLEEAIAVNDAKTRRKLLLDILHKNPEEHIALLQRARLTDDTELTHYATTTMMEIQGSYEQNIRMLEADIKILREENRRDGLEKGLRKLRKELEMYIDSGLISGNILNIYRRKLDGVFDELLALAPENRNYYLGKIENEIEQGILEGLEERLLKAKEMWPEDVQVYMVLVHYYAATYQGEKIQQVLLEMESEEVYLSSEGKKWFAFWKSRENPT